MDRWLELIIGGIESFRGDSGFDIDGIEPLKCSLCITRRYYSHVIIRMWPGLSQPWSLYSQGSMCTW